MLKFHERRAITSFAMAAPQSSGTLQKKKNNYKLLVDPELKKGHKKVYRLNGKDEPGVRHFSTSYTWCALIRNTLPF